MITNVATSQFFFVKKHCSAHKATNEAGLHDDNNDELNSL
jgi:hypothetical protein